jgi:hypothetical protein
MPRNNSISDSVNFSLLIFKPQKIQITSSIQPTSG